MKKRFLTVGGYSMAELGILLLCVFVALVLCCAPAMGAGEKSPPAPPEDAPSIGTKDAPVTIVEFVDYQ